jgi:hypothetical protein
MVLSAFASEVLQQLRNVADDAFITANEHVLHHPIVAAPGQPVEEAGRVRKRGPLGEGQLHDNLVRLAGADHSGVRPHRNPAHRVRRLSPFHLLDHVGVGLLDEHSGPSERLGPRIVQLLGSRIDP